MFIIDSPKFRVCCSITLFFGFLLFPLLFIVLFHHSSEFIAEPDYEYISSTDSHPSEIKIETFSDHLRRENSFLLPEFVLCPSESFEISHLESTLRAALEHFRSPIQSKSKRIYPHQFFNREKFNFPSCINERLLEFPILPRGKIFKAGDSPGPFRIIATEEILTNQKGKIPKYCGLIAHPVGKSKHSKSFELCIANDKIN